MTGAVLREVASHGKTMRLEKFEVKNIEHFFYLKVLLERCHTLSFAYVLMRSNVNYLKYFVTRFPGPCVSPVKNGDLRAASLLRP